MKTCRICARPGGGIRFGVLCCKGCKEFYRRSIEKGPEFKCFLGGNCSSNFEAVLGQRNCKACRYRKCIELGMQFPTVSHESNTKRRLECDREIIPSQNETPESLCDGFEDIPSSTDCFSDISRDSALSTVNSDDEIVPSGKMGISRLEATYPALILRPHDRSSNIILCRNLPDKPAGSMQFSPIYPAFRFEPPIDYEASDFLRLISRCPRNAGEHRNILAQTIFAVEKATQTVFSREISTWTRFKQSFIQTHGLKPAKNSDKSDSALSAMLVAVNQHNRDNAQRVLQFARLLPGMDETGIAARRFFPGRWKWIVFWMIHHAPFTCEAENYMILGENNLHYSRYWVERLFDPNLRVFERQFTGELRELKLTQTETYLLMAVIMFEPDVRDPVNSCSTIVHHHYADALLFCIKQRCSTSNQFAEVCGKLGDFFNRLKLASLVHTRYFSYSGGDWPAAFQMLKDVALSEYRVHQRKLEIGPAVE